jgi:hypothetical protein
MDVRVIVDFNMRMTVEFLFKDRLINRSRLLNILVMGQKRDLPCLV